MGDRQTEGTEKQPVYRQGEQEEMKRKPVIFQHVVEVDLEINRVHDAAFSESDQSKDGSKRRPYSSQRAKRKCCSAKAIEGRKCPCDTPIPMVPSSLSQASVISDTAAEELCDLRKYYSKQLQRINYISLEHLSQPAEPGILSCIREPLKSLHLPHSVTIALKARSLWTRVSSRRKRVGWRQQHPPPQDCFTVWIL